MCLVMPFFGNPIFLKGIDNNFIVFNQIQTQDNSLINEENEKLMSDREESERIFLKTGVFYSEESFLDIVTAHLPIVITGDSDFANQAQNEGWIGNGSQFNPYIIRDYTFSQYVGTGIAIFNTRVFFVIQNVSVSGMEGTYPNGIGFRLVNVQNGKLINNTSNGNRETGFSLEDTSFITMINNTALNNRNIGFLLEDSTSNIIINNTASNDGLWGFLVSFCDNNVLINNKAMGNGDGFYIEVSNFNSFENNVAIQNRKTGFYLSLSSNNNLTFNTAEENLNGYFITGQTTDYNCSSNIFQQNKAYNNANIGLFLDTRCINNLLLGNILEANKQIDAQDETPPQNNPRNSLNWWLGNSYTNYFNQGFYIISGKAGAIDSNPQLPKTDSDGDGIPDWFEKKYHLNLLVDDSLLDPDNDGLTNYQEFLLNKDPHTPDSDNIVHTMTVTEPSPPTTTTETSTITNPASTVTVPDTTTETTADTTTKTSMTTETSITIKTSITTIISQIVETMTKTTEGFGLVFMCLTMLGLLLIRRKKKK